MKKTFIKNRKQQNISVVIENEHGNSGLVFVMHGLGDNKDSSHIVEYTKPFLENDFVVVKFDTTNTFGESDGNFEDATLTNYYQDLEDVIDWASHQDFYKEKFMLIGHSLGAISSGLYTQKYNDKILSLIVISSPINYELSKSTYSDEELNNWKTSGFLTEDWDGFMVKLKWNYMEDKKKYNLLQDTEKFTMPVLMIAGENDDVTPYNHQKKLFDKIQSHKEIYVIKNGPHTFRDKKDLDEVKTILNKWIKTISIIYCNKKMPQNFGGID